MINCKYRMFRVGECFLWITDFYMIETADRSISKMIIYYIIFSYIEIDNSFKNLKNTLSGNLTFIESE